MRIITYCIALVMWVLAAFQCHAQEIYSLTKIEVLELSKEEIINEEKDALKGEVEAINKRVEDGEITEEEGGRLKNEAAEKRALNIENRLAIVDNKIALLKRNGEGDEILENDKIEIKFFGEGRVFGIDYTPKKRKYDRRTTSDFVFAFGFNNVITEGESLEDSDFKVAGSRFAELGWAWKTRVFKETNWLRIKYGFSFQFNGLKPTDNRYFVDTGTQTELQTFDRDLDKSKFRIDNLVVPVHFEVGPSRKVEGKDYFRYYTHRKVKFGFGGYAGLRLATRQKLKFNDGAEDIKQKQKGNFNASNFIYGVSAYIGWRGSALYAKYDLNPIFKDNPVEQRNLSLGLRFDMD
ncbi:hypothetical protein POV27_03935 [Aureisphaera galaxeae]|uniref:hypothetical protein n=1 Tax=Aureisphaera galaxeae TaxID=1538023 RepID=UPI0023504669|nr:hypothetical protein [Aureisphaera galaxeae]MDC8003185.1 hypothetical protein [Aureisphaera galaxeae]